MGSSLYRAPPAMRLPSLVFVLVCVAAFQKSVRSNEAFRQREPREIFYFSKVDNLYDDREQIQSIPNSLAAGVHEDDDIKLHRNPSFDVYSTSLGHESDLDLTREVATSFELEYNENINTDNQEGFGGFKRAEYISEFQIIVENTLEDKTRPFDGGNRAFNKEATEDIEFKNDQQVFRVFWNVPSKECFNFNISLKPEQYGFTVNKDQDFNGDQIVLMYGPGEFPRILANGTSVNGGVPQRADLRLHLQKLREDIQRDVPNPNFSGVAVIDMESWEPELASSPAEYRQLSCQLVQEQHPDWTDAMIDELAREDFEWWARLVLQATLQEAKRARPLAVWGYYQYPLCKNLAVKNGTCPISVRESNDRLLWLFGESTALYPSLYLFLHGYTAEDRHAAAAGRLQEALRFAVGPAVYPYTWFQYHDDEQYLPQEDLMSMLGQARELGLPGAVMWGATANCDTLAQCRRLEDYLHSTLGPVVQQLTATSQR